MRRRCNEGRSHEPADSDTTTQKTRIDPRLLESSSVPLTKTTLEYDVQKQELISRAARLAYPIRDGIPIMLPEEARPIETE
ncbi:MAG: Trm112 family protein [Methylovirgula sp.]